MAGENVVSILVKADNLTGAGFGEAAASAEGLAAKTKAAMDEYTVAMDEAGKAQAHLEELQRGGVASADELAAAQDKVTQATIRSLNAQVKLGEAELAESAKAREAGTAQETLAAKTKESGAAATTTGGLFGSFKQVAGLAMVGVGYESIKMAMSFQKAMEMLVTQAGVPQSHLAALKAGVLDLAGKVGFSPDSLAESLYHVASNMASMGASSATMLRVVQTAAEGAKVGGASLVDVTNALGAAIASGIPGVQNYSQAMGALNAIVGAGDMKMQDLAEAMGSGVLAVVKGYGLSLKDVGAALATFGDLNVRGANAATFLRMAVQSLAVPAAAGKKLLEGMGLSMTTLGADMRQGGLMKALDDLQAHFKAAGITAKEQGDVITQIFGKKAGPGLSILMEQMDRLKSKYPAITEGANKFGDAWHKTQQNLSQQWDQLRGTFDALMTSIGTRLIPVLSSIASFLLRNKGIIETLTPVVLGLVAAFALVETVMKAVKIASAAFTLLTNPVGLVIVAVAALAIGIYELVKHFSAVKHAATEVFDWIKSHWLLLTPLLATPLGPIIALGLGIYELVKHFKAVEGAAKTAWHAIEDAWAHVWSAVIAPVVKAFDAVKSAITGGFDGWWKSHGKEIEQVWHAIWSVISAVFKAFWDYTAGIAKIGWDIIKTVFKTAWDVIVGILKPGLVWLEMIFKVTWASISAVFKTAWDIIAAVVKIAWDGIKSVIKTAWDIIVGIFNVALDLVTGHWSKAWTDLKRMGEQIWNNIKDFLSSVWHAIESLVTQVVNNIKGFLSAAWNAIKNGVVTAFNDVLAFFRGLPGKILGALGDLGSLLLGAGKAIMRGLLNGIRAGWHDVTGFVGQVGSWIANLKGPLPHDLTLLVPHGQAIMQGLMNGMNSRLPALRSQLTGISGTIGGGIGPGGAAGGYGGAYAGGGPIQLQVVAGGGSAFEQFMLLAIREWVRTKGGGNVQRAFGR